MNISNQKEEEEEQRNLELKDEIYEPVTLKYTEFLT